MIILLRCTISDSATSQEECRAGLDRLWSTLQQASNDGWDLAGLCISRCAESVFKLGNVSAHGWGSGPGTDSGLLGPAGITNGPWGVDFFDWGETDWMDSFMEEMV